jgi:hypothetical protein
MRTSSKAFLACSFGLLLASCAPKPAPIEPEPLYDKYGSVIVTNECRPSSQPISPNYPERLPICAEECAPGTMRNPQFTTTEAVTRIPQCVPIPDDNDDAQGQRGQLN